MLLAEADARMQASTGTRWVGVTSHPANDPDGWQLTTTTVLDVVPTQTLPNTWADHPEPGVWNFGSSDGIGNVRNNRTRILHNCTVRAAARGIAVIPVTPLHGVHYVRFRVVDEENGFAITGQRTGTVGVTDAAAPFDAERGGRSWGFELYDFGWRHCSDAYQPAERRGPLLPHHASNRGCIITLRIDCQTRMVSVATNYEMLTDPDRSPRDNARFFEVPIPLDEDIESLRPWVVSAFDTDIFELFSVEASARLAWTPSTHARFPRAVRAYVRFVLRLGYQLATRLPTAHEQGAFVDRFVGGVLPAVIDGTEFATLRALGEPIANDPMPVAPSGVTQ